MGTSRLEAFSDGVIAIIITTMVLSHVAAIGLALRWPDLAIAIYAGLALIWLVPDRRIERALAGRSRRR